MKYFYIAITLLALTCIQTNAQEKCPTGKPRTQDCSPQTCPSGSICYRKNNEKFCCGDLDTFCPTKMHAFNSEDKMLTYSWGPITDTKWYDVKSENEIIACPMPFSFTYLLYEEVKVLPVDFEKSETSKPKTCEKNSDCNKENEEFCGAASHPMFTKELLDKSGKNGAPLRFCYNFQNFGFSNIKPIINANEKELVGCDSNADCAGSQGTETFCFEKKGTFVRIAGNDGKITVNKGFCAVAQVCDHSKHEDIVASLSKSNTFCQKNEDCQGSAKANKHSGMEPECVAAPNLPEVKLCCFQHDKDCEVGRLQYPLKQCSSFESCNNKDSELVMDKWCDKKNKHCCEGNDDDKELWACPDGATPLFNEPECSDFSPSDIDSGKCPEDGGICRRGHCCPSLVKSGENEFKVGEKIYTTNSSCKPDKPIPKHFNYAFCDRENNKIVIVGATDVNGESIAKNGTNCKSNMACKTEHVCMKRSNDEHYCVANPLKKKTEAAGVWAWLSENCKLVIIIIVFLLFAICLLVGLGIWWRCFRKKDEPKPTTPEKQKNIDSPGQRDFKKHLSDPPVAKSPAATKSSEANSPSASQEVVKSPEEKRKGSKSPVSTVPTTATHVTDAKVRKTAAHVADAKVRKTAAHYTKTTVPTKTSEVANYSAAIKSSDVVHNPAPTPEATNEGSKEEEDVDNVNRNAKLPEPGYQDKAVAEMENLDLIYETDSAPTQEESGKK